MKKRKFPIKYLDGNLVFHSTSGEVYAYYEWMPYNYSCVGEDEAHSILLEMERLFSRTKTDKFHMLMINTEESIHDTIVRSKNQVKGELTEIAYDFLDGVEEHLKRLHGENEIAVRFFIGFLLSGEEFVFSGQKVSLRETLASGVKDFFQSVNEEVFGDYVRVNNGEVQRYQRLEKMVYDKINRRFRMRRVEPENIAYIMKHLNGQKGISYEDYHYQPECIIEGDERKLRSYDVLRLADSKIEVEDRSLRILTEDATERVAYLAVSEMVGTNPSPFGSEVIYHMQEVFDFPVDVSLQVEVLKHDESLTLIRNKKADLEDLDESAFEAGRSSSHALYDAKEDVVELESTLEKTKEVMYRVSWLLRVSGKDEEELFSRITEVKDYYRNYNFILQCPLCDQAGLHEEFYPGTDRYMNDYTQYVKAEFLAGLGFGAIQKLGERDGIYVGFATNTMKSIYIKPWLPAQGVSGTVTNALARAFLGSLGGGKSVAMNLQAFWTVLFGGRSLIVDPKGERGNWVEDLSFLGDALNLINVIPGESNRGLFDPFHIMTDIREAEMLALNVFTMLTGVNMQDGKRFPVLREHVKRVAGYRDKPKGMLCVVEELERTGSSISLELATHIQAFSDLGISSLIFGDGTHHGTLNINSPLNVLLMQELLLPDRVKPVKEYSASELLSTIVLLVVSTFSLEFIRQDRRLFKQVVLDEAWAWLQINEGKTMANKLVREGRAMNAAIDFGTQNCDDLLDEKMKNNIGMKFAFRSTDMKEIEKTLVFMGLEFNDHNIELLRGLENGQCLFCDPYGHCGKMYFDCVYASLFNAFDTRPPQDRIA